MIKERKIETDNIKIKLYSPMIVRNHNRETLKDMYYSFEREEFKQYLKINILEQMKAEGLDSSLLNGFDIIPVNAKKTVLPVYEKMIECSIGEFGLIGDSRLLNYLYKARNRIKEGHGIRII
jgi:CRISPR-associated endoribonuclease Cas6